MAADGGGDLRGEVATHAHTARRKIAFREVRIVVEETRGWAGCVCRLIAADGAAFEVGCGVLSSISADGAIFPVTVETKNGARHGPFAAEGIAGGFPSGAGCFVFRRDQDGFWNGVTLTIAFGRLAVAPYACDPI